MFFMNAYGEKVVTYLQNKNGVKYDVNQKEPYTGKFIEAWPNGKKKLKGISKMDNLMG